MHSPVALLLLTQPRYSQSRFKMAAVYGGMLGNFFTPPLILDRYVMNDIWTIAQNRVGIL